MTSTYTQLVKVKNKNKCKHNKMAPCCLRLANSLFIRTFTSWNASALGRSETRRMDGSFPKKKAFASCRQLKEIGLCENPWPILECGRLHASFGTGLVFIPGLEDHFGSLSGVRHGGIGAVSAGRVSWRAGADRPSIPARDEKESLHVEAAVRLALRHCSKALAEIGHRAVGTRQTPRARACP